MSCTSNTPNIDNTFNIDTTNGLVLSACTMLYANNITPCSGDTINIIGDLDANQINAEVFYSGGTNLLTIFGGANIVITGFTYNDANIITIGTNVGNDFSVDISTMSNLLVTGELSGTTFYGDGSGLSGIQLLSESQIITVDDTPTLLGVISGITSDETRFVESYVTAHNSTSDYGFWKRTLGVVNVGGVSTIILENADIDIYSTGLSGTNITYNINGPDIEVHVVGENSTTYNWVSDWNIIKNS